MTDLERRHRPGEAPDAVPAGVGAAGGRTAGSGPASGGMAGEETGGEALASVGAAGGGTLANDGSATGGLASGGGGPAEDAPDEILARLGASLEPIDPPASLRSELLKRIAHEPQMREPAGTGSSRSGLVAGAPVDPESAEAGSAETGAAETGAAETAVAEDAPDEAATAEPEPADSAPAVEPGARGGTVEPDPTGAATAEPGTRGGTVDGRSGAVVPLRPRRRRWSAIGLRVAAAAAVLCVGIGVGRWTAMSSMAPTEHYAHLNQAQDVQRVTDTMPDGHIATLTWSRGMSMTALSLPDEMMDAARGGSLQVWLRKGETVSSLGLYDPQSGTGFTFLDLMPEAGEQVFITREPAGGSDQPTGEPLVTFDVRADGTTTRRSPTPDGGGTDT